MRHRVRGTGWAILVLGLGLAWTPVALAQDDGSQDTGEDDGGGEGSVGPDDDSGAGASGGLGSPPLSEVDRPVLMPAPGRIRLMPRWDNTIFTESRPLGIGGASLAFTSWTSLFAMDVDLHDVVVRALLPLTYLRSQLDV